MLIVLATTQVPKYAFYYPQRVLVAATLSILLVILATIGLALARDWLDFEIDKLYEKSAAYQQVRLTFTSRYMISRHNTIDLYL